MLVAFNRFADESRSAKIQLRRPSHAHARYSNDREFSTRQHARKLPSVLKGNRKRIGKKAAQGNAERNGVAGLQGRTEAPLNAQGAAHHTKRRPTRAQPVKPCGAPSESQPSRKPQNTPAELRAARKPITASDEHAKPQTGTTRAKRKPPGIMRINETAFRKNVLPCGNEGERKRLAHRGPTGKPYPYGNEGEL